MRLRPGSGVDSGFVPAVPLDEQSGMLWWVSVSHRAHLAHHRILATFVLSEGLQDVCRRKLLLCVACWRRFDGPTEPALSRGIFGAQVADLATPSQSAGNPLNRLSYLRYAYAPRVSSLARAD